ncbi:hypothetical protein F511_11796 [Dorcoceras hygrometricum]|uniref:Uncharacterized protein n=1 Tax=Dorcoceras hygrometricum TaxID=472368 RepID=A0A2Z7CK77_9LAMI|nr:hypothetical protein F511_11796 [Dorcoceras hygrometricum]
MVQDDRSETGYETYRIRFLKTKPTLLIFQLTRSCRFTNSCGEDGKSPANDHHETLQFGTVPGQIQPVESTLKHKGGP